MIQIFISNPMSIKDVNYNNKFTSKYISDINDKLKNTNTKIVIHLMKQCRNFALKLM
jgi:hypothetical protein